ncbi:hypothetical protein [Caballeronia sp. LZ001]|uniref:hypothetical protein n=1 Tax=Caballeronia sp. LZ001 TaxID=3038553 RepID=UPI00285D8092|nr:hypothetical protein [Caballeronia sp. LZ001]MDR5806524.1 hypothetical protein [Caballeronia sp. LZ001]
MELLKDPWWRVRYGALDASFNIGNDDRFASFRQALVHLTKAKESHSRVLGLCGDDFLGWIRDGANDDDTRRRILADPEIRKRRKAGSRRRTIHGYSNTYIYSSAICIRQIYRSASCCHPRSNGHLISEARRLFGRAVTRNLSRGSSRFP